jgi:hypothetical protein
MPPRKKVRTLPVSGFYGVIASGKKWQAQICYDGMTHYLGCFDTKQEAALAYDREVRRSGTDKPLNYESIAAAEEAAACATLQRMCAKQPKPRPSSGFYGVTANRKRWTAKIHYNGTEHNLGTFDTKQEAALTYDKKARQCGKDKPLNYESVKAAEEAALAHDREARQRGEEKLLNYESINAAEEAAAHAQAEHTLTHPKQPNPRSASGFYGVSAKGKWWQVKICYDGKRRYLGNFETKQEAALAYDRAARQRGEEKLLNYENIAAAEEAAAHAQAEHTLTYPKQPKPRPPSGFYGVYANGKRWQAKICYDSKQHYLGGTFNTKEAAALAYDREARQCGEEKPLNYESIKAAEEAAVKAQADHRYK